MRANTIISICLLTLAVTLSSQALAANDFTCKAKISIDYQKAVHEDFTLCKGGTLTLTNPYRIGAKNKLVHTIMEIKSTGPGQLSATISGKKNNTVNISTNDPNPKACKYNHNKTEICSLKYHINDSNPKHDYLITLRNLSTGTVHIILKR